MTLKEFIETNPAIMPDGPLNRVFGPSGMLDTYEANKDKSNRILCGTFIILVLITPCVLL